MSRVFLKNYIFSPILFLAFKNKKKKKRKQSLKSEIKRKR